MVLTGVIFDCDGTLADTLPVCVDALREVLEPRLGREIPDDVIRRQFGPSEEGILQRLIPDQWEDCLEAYLRAYARLHRERPVAIPGITLLLDRLLACGLRLAVVTAKGPRSAAISLEALGLASYFQAVEAGSPHGEHKAESIGKVLARWSAPAQAVAYVGDMKSDVRAARAAGVIGLGAAWAPGADAAALQGESPVNVFRKPQDLWEWVEAQGRGARA